jgi:hypothetical protein
MIVNYPEKKSHGHLASMEKDRTAYEKNCAEKELNIVGKETKQKSDEALLKVSLKAGQDVGEQEAYQR